MLNLIASLWCLPGTLIGFVLVLLSGGRWFSLRWTEGVLHVATDCGLAGWFFRTFGFGAITLGEVVLYRSVEAVERHARHELRHVWQWRILGPLFPLAYFVGWLLAGCSYSGNWFERDARRHG